VVPVQLQGLAADAENRSDDAIAARLRGDDPGAVEALWAEYGRVVFAYLMRTLKDVGDAEDVHQQVFTEAWQRRREYDPDRANLFTWLMMIARSRAIDSARRRRPEPVDPVLTAETVADPNPSPQEKALERWRLVHLLSRIPAEEARLLRLRFYEELSQREIADLTGIPLGTVKMRMVQALDRLRRLIEIEEAER
jgi:RNA polymerase sigma-70 factor (ECF subfamily)